MRPECRLNRKHERSFDQSDLSTFVALAHQVGIAIENANLYQEIHLLFEGFISASVQAIESRDPSTSGHSQRVAALTCRLAEVVTANDAGPYARIRFGAAQLKEIRYAAVLHDFGKVGIREHILVKARKLYPGQIDLLKARFDFIKRTFEAEALREKLALYERGNGAATELSLAQIDRRLQHNLQNTDDTLAFLLTCSHPSSTDPANIPRLTEYAKQQYRSFDGLRPYVTDEELGALSVLSGSLTNEERRDIEQHVTHTFEFLSKIPWMRSLKYVPEIAWCHHERIDGSGYPRGLTKEKIPIQARMMAICDIYDALTAADRPYKSAVSSDEALKQLSMLATEGKIDTALLELFIRERVYETTLLRPRKIA